MSGKIVVGLVVFLLILACIFSFDSGFDYTYKLSGADDYVKVDLETPTDINEQLLNHSLDRTFSFLDTFGSWFRDVWNRGVTLVSYVSGNFDYEVESTMQFVSVDAYYEGISELQDYLYEVEVAYYEAKGSILKKWQISGAYRSIYTDWFAYPIVIESTYVCYSFYCSVCPNDSDVYTLNSAEGWAHYSGLTAEAVHLKFAAAGLSHYYNSTYYKYIIECPPLIYGPPAPEETTTS